MECRAIGRRSQFLLVLGHMKVHPKTTLRGVVFQKLNGPLLASALFDDGGTGRAFGESGHGASVSVAHRFGSDWSTADMAARWARWDRATTTLRFRALRKSSTPPRRPKSSGTNLNNQEPLHRRGCTSRRRPTSVGPFVQANSYPEVLRDNFKVPWQPGADIFDHVGECRTDLRCQMRNDPPVGWRSRHLVATASMRRQPFPKRRSVHRAISKSEVTGRHEW